MSEENVELARQGIERLGRDGVEAIIELCDPGIEWIAIPGFLPDAEDFQGHAGVRAWFQKVGEVFGDFRLELEEIADAPDGRLFIALRFAAVGRTSGIAGELRVFQAWTIRDGRLVRLASFLARDDALAAAGLSGREPAQRPDR